MFKPVLEAAVNGALTTKVAQNPPNFLSSSIKSYDSFKTELIKALGHAQGQMIQTASLRKKLDFALIKTPNGDFGTKPSF